MSVAPGISCRYSGLHLTGAVPALIHRIVKFELCHLHGFRLCVNDRGVEGISIAVQGEFRLQPVSNVDRNL